MAEKSGVDGKVEEVNQGAGQDLKLLHSDSRHSAADSLSSQKKPTPLLHRPIPATVGIYYQWSISGLRTYHVCGENEHDHIFAVSAHTGSSMSGPLGAYPGIHLYNGPSSSGGTPLLAAFGQESIFSGLTFRRRSAVFIPGANGASGWAKETLLACTTQESDGLKYTFTVIVGLGPDRRSEHFEWRKVKKSDEDEDIKLGGFKLFWLAANAEENGGPSTAAHIGSDDKDEAVAVMSWNNFSSTRRHPFDLKYTGDESFVKLGERTSLMVLITALGLHWLHIRGRTKRAPVALAEKMDWKGKSVA